MYDLNGKVALVTGTSNKRGLGCGIALRLAREGADVVVSDRNRSPGDLESWDREEGWLGLDSLVTEIKTMGRQSLAVTADISSSQDVNAMVATVLERFGKIDILVNNAALILRDLGNVPIVEMNEEIWTRALAVNLTGTFHMCKAVGKQMILQGKGGKIINMSSTFGKKAEPGRAAYAASKFGIIGLTQALALELAQYKINVNAICPGTTVTWASRGQAIRVAMAQGLSENDAIDKVYQELGLAQQMPLGRIARVEDVANVVAFLASSQSDYMTGQAINVTGGRLVVH